MNDYQQSETKDDMTAIDYVRDTHVAALNSGEAHAWATLFTDDGVQMPPNMPANNGRAAIEGWSAAFLDMFAVKFALSVDEVRILGEWAFERGAYTIDLKPKPEGPPMKDAGKYVTIYQKKSGAGWLMARDIWNSSNPPPGM